MSQQKRAVKYCRVSTKEQVEEGNSLVSQEKICRVYAEKYEYEVAGIFIEMGESAKTADRKLDQDYSVFYDDIGKGYKLYYYREGILRGQYCYEIGYDRSYIIVKSSSTPQSKEDKFIKYINYIIDKAQYKSNLAYPKNPGLFGPFDQEK